MLAFDLDGTLVESVPDLATACNRSLADHGLPQVDEPTVRRAVGEGARTLVARLLPAGTSEERVDAVWASFREHYLRVCTDRTFLLPGALEFLDARVADGFRMALLTNKPQAPTERIAAHLGLDRRLERLLGGDTPLGRKPEPDGLRSLMAAAGAEPDETLMIGDGPADLAVAARAGVPAVLLRGGYGRTEKLEGLPRLLEVDGLPGLEQAWGRVLEAFGA